jgi:hypothetical protein
MLLFITSIIYYNTPVHFTLQKYYIVQKGSRVFLCEFSVQTLKLLQFLYRWNLTNRMTKYRLILNDCRTFRGLQFSNRKKKMK